MKKYNYVYRIDDPITKEFYIGSRTSKVKPEFDIKYFGSMYAWKPEDKSRLIKTILKSKFKTRESTIKFEAKLITEYIKDPLNRNYHIPSVGYHMAGVILTKSHKDKISNARLGIKFSDETKERISKARTGIKLSQETKDKLSIAASNRIRKPHSKETKEKIAKAQIGTKLSQETKDNISSACKGLTRSQETRDRISKALIGNKYALSMKPSDETKERISKAQKIRWSLIKRKKNKNENI